MNKDELKELVKKYFKLTDITNQDKLEVKAESFDSATLVDGTKITNKESDDFAVGQTLYVITEAGEEVTAPSGEHTTQSGIVIVVDGEGKITGYHRPGETGQGSLAEQEMSESSEEKTEMDEHVDEDAIQEEAIGATFDEGEIKEAIVEAIAEVVAPEIEAMKKKMAEIEEAIRVDMAKPAAKPSMESRFNKIQEIKSKKENTSESFNAKKAQMDMVLNAFKSKIKTTA
tara:strand:+ start:3015 stop:3701 length:687 start_codon:yes stop_codon:yes gene_type:complete